MIFIDIILGIAIGFILGLIPSFHINVLAYVFILLGVFYYFSDNFYFFFSLAITMTIVSIVPLLLHGAPTADNFALNLGQPGSHSLSPYVFGFLFGSIFSVILLPFFYLLFLVFSNFYFLIFFVLFLVLVFLVFSDNDRFLAFVIVVFSGLLGIITLKYNFFFSEPLLPCIFGLFALPTLLASFADNMASTGESHPVQEIVRFKSSIFSAFLGSLFSVVIAIVPSLSPGIACILPSVFFEKHTAEKKHVLLSSTLISVILIYFFMALVFKKSRLGFVSILLENGIISSFSFPDMLLLCFVFLFVVSISCFFLLLFYPHISMALLRLPRRSSILAVILFSTLLIILVSNIFSILLIILSCSIGMLPIVYNKNKLLLMSYLIVPTILFFI